MKYRHIKTGAVIDIRSELKDRDWEPLAAPAPTAPKEPVKAAVAPAQKSAAAKKPAQTKTTAGSRKK